MDNEIKIGIHDFLEPIKDNVKLTDEQILMLQMSDLDIKNGNLIPLEQLDKVDLKWLSEQ